MSITMQGNWRVQVKLRSAAFKQRFVIQGSDNADGAYEGKTTTPPVDVRGQQWTITVQHKRTGRNQPWQPSDERLTSPYSAGNRTFVDVQSNDSGGDVDFNDLVLACSYRRTAIDHLIYGKVRWYEGFCKVNPCFPHFVIDTVYQLRELLPNKAVREVVQTLYPERLKRIERNLPESEPWRPMILPLESGIPAEPEIAEQAGDGDDEIRSEVAAAPAESNLVMGEMALATQLLDHSLELARLKDRLVLACKHGPLPGLLLRFQEYDRTNEELNGGPYTGTGDRAHLGNTATDMNGRYIFRFRRTLGDILEELGDRAAGEAFFPAIRPDVIVQALGDPGDGSPVLFETAVHQNIPSIKRIDLCLPKDSINPGPTACQAGRAIQAIGNIWTLPGMADDVDPVDGRVTKAGSAVIRNAAWGGVLDLFACFLDHPNARFYTISFKRSEDAGWVDVEQKYTHPKLSDLHLPDYNGTAVGPFWDKGNDLAGRPYYLNIESDPGWVVTHRIRKMRLFSWLYESATANRTVRFKIEAYNAAGNKIAGAEDSIRLYIDNRPVTGQIDSLTMGAQAPGECGLFQVVTNNETIDMRYKVHQPGGALYSYSVGVLHGSATPTPVTDAVDPDRTGQVYDPMSHGDFFFGTANVASADGAGFVTAELTPTAGWLPPGRDFCAFAFEIYGRARRTNGYGTPAGKRLDAELVGIERVTP